jgi:broad specificity phosphatase PhoE
MKHNLATLYIVRHGETDWNIKKLIQGQTDIPLNTVGEEQARKLAEELKHIEFDGVFSSDLVRARRTAEIVSLEKQLEIKTTQMLRERHFGEFEGQEGHGFFQKLLEQWTNLSEEEKWNHTMGNEESQHEAVMRMITFLRETAIGYPGKTTLITSHGGIMRALLVKLGYATWDTVGDFENCGYIVLQSDGVDFFFKEAKGIKKWQGIPTK